MDDGRKTETVPRMPGWVRGWPEARRLWRTYYRRLADAGKWRPEYEPTFCAFIEAFASFGASVEEWCRQGRPVQATSPQGNDYFHPLKGTIVAEVRELLKTGDKLGLNPLADARIKAQARGVDLGPLFDLMKGVAE